MGGAALVFGVDSVRKDNHLICGLNRPGFTGDL